jgi:hypothetical protein
MLVSYRTFACKSARVSERDIERFLVDVRVCRAFELEIGTVPTSVLGRAGEDQGWQAPQYRARYLIYTWHETTGLTSVCRFEIAMSLSTSEHSSKQRRGYLEVSESDLRRSHPH